MAIASTTDWRLWPPRWRHSSSWRDKQQTVSTATWKCSVARPGAEIKRASGKANTNHQTARLSDFIERCKRAEQRLSNKGPKLGTICELEDSGDEGTAFFQAESQRRRRGWRRGGERGGGLHSNASFKCGKVGHCYKTAETGATDRRAERLTLTI